MPEFCIPKEKNSDETLKTNLSVINPTCNDPCEEMPRLFYVDLLHDEHLKPYVHPWWPCVLGTREWSDGFFYEVDKFFSCMVPRVHSFIFEEQQTR
jgi:hypothetical protein